MPDSEPTEHDIDEGDDEDDDYNDVVQYVCHSLVVFIVDVYTTDHEEQDAHYYLQRS